MTNNTFNLDQNINQMSESDMMAIAYELNALEPGAGHSAATSAHTSAIDTAISAVQTDPALALSLFSITAAIACAMVLLAPSLIKAMEAARRLAAEKIAPVIYNR